MRIVHCALDLRAAVDAARAAGDSIAFVPTMGNLHAGHHSLLHRAREHAGFVVASVFVNPTQFGPNEDFARYPRTPEADAAGLAAQGCDLLFLPGVDEIYPLGAEAAVRVHVPGVTESLEGAIRPGHFDGVATVVAKLFNLVRPDVAVFGQKDYQQLLVIRRMVRDLAFPLEILAAPIVREANGLAMSSRNQYLDAATRDRAGAIHATLLAMQAAIHAGTMQRDQIEAMACAQLEQAGFLPDYAVLRRADDLSEPVGDERAGLVALIAARSGRTRLIDNLLIR
ncbi:pantoate--beta-alanine ligase [Dokdonella sp.]|uniref:pantoate--beta-alanine ligase n=1 Tax=Dokdonella sp. TaxID=2291710 RepID=UPI0025BA1AF3|nr:pantoate--beta-alanine ligase [Dokdonella sp.]MBX3688518.1 pantoate--beta-alanine ligase [Dokdonella sp.]